MLAQGQKGEDSGACLPLYLLLELKEVAVTMSWRQPPADSPWWLWGVAALESGLDRQEKWTTEEGADRRYRSSPPVPVNTSGSRRSTSGGWRGGAAPTVGSSSGRCRRNGRIWWCSKGLKPFLPQRSLTGINPVKTSVSRLPSSPKWGSVLAGMTGAVFLVPARSTLGTCVSGDQRVHSDLPSLRFDGDQESHGSSKSITWSAPPQVLRSSSTDSRLVELLRGAPGADPWGVASFDLKTSERGHHKLFQAKHPHTGGGNSHDDRLGRI